MSETAQVSWSRTRRGEKDTKAGGIMYFASFKSTRQQGMDYGTGMLTVDGPDAQAIKHGQKQSTK